MSIADSHACAIVGAGQVKCWGQLTGDLPLPSLEFVELGGEAVEIVAELGSSCARLESGEVLCWGSGQYGQTGHPWPGSCEIVAGQDVLFDCDADPSCCIGDDETPASVGPIELPGPAKDLAGTPMGWCALLEGGAVHCWGSGLIGLIGDGQTPDCIQPDLWDLQCGLDPRCCVGDDETPAAAARPVVFE